QPRHEGAKGVAELRPIAVWPVLDNGAQERHLDGEIILDVTVIDETGRPGGHLGVRYDDACIEKLRRATPAGARHVPDPATLDLVAERVDVDCAVGCFRGPAQEYGQ